MRAWSLLGGLAALFFASVSGSEEGGLDIRKALINAHEEVLKHHGIPAMNGGLGHSRKKRTPVSSAMAHRNKVLGKVRETIENEVKEPTDKVKLFDRIDEEFRQLFALHPSVVSGSRLFLSHLHFVSDACSATPQISCAQTRYREIDGRCNNLQHPLWGASNIAMRRYLLPAYQDNSNVPRGGFVSSEDNRGALFPLPRPFSAVSQCTSNPSTQLPNPRLVSSIFHSDRDLPDPQLTHMVTQMGQFLDHDITLTPEAEEEDCCHQPSGHEECFPIRVPRTDSLATNHNQNCLEFSRSTSFCENLTTKREQMNGITAFIDGSNVYGSDTKSAQDLRENKDGLLKVESSTGGFPMLPQFANDKNEIVEQAGDVRAREMNGLASMHTLFVREHNRIAKELKAWAPNWSDETLYQEARRINVAQMQNVVYGQYVQAIFGPSNAQAYGLSINPGRTKYDPNIDPSIKNAFATATYRFGHSMINGLIRLLNPGNRHHEVDNFLLRDGFFDLTKYHSFSGLGMDAIIAGLINQPTQRNDIFVSQEVTNHLFPEDNKNFGSDLMARNIQRGRDHGLPSYNEFRAFCGLPKICSWYQVPAEISADKWQLLSRLYDSPSDIDLMTGGLSENPFNGAVFGRTFVCINARQFSELKYGDRYFFTHNTDVVSRFSDQQTLNLKQRDLGSIICDNTKITETGVDVFQLNSPRRSCAQRNQLQTRLFVLNI